jgi:hypothetical protein
MSFKYAVLVLLLAPACGGASSNPAPAIDPKTELGALSDQQLMEICTWSVSGEGGAGAQHLCATTGSLPVVTPSVSDCETFFTTFSTACKTALTYGDYKNCEEKLFNGYCPGLLTEECSLWFNGQNYCSNNG